MRRVVGIDLSLTSTGVATIQGGQFTGLVNVKSSGKKDDDLYKRADRLFQLANQVESFAWETGMPDLVVIEAPSYGSKYGHPHDRSGLWWLIVNAFRNDGVAVAQVAPQTRAKYGTGAGNSGKDVVLAHVLERYGHRTPRRIKNDDEADAVILAAMGARQLGEPVDPELEGSNLAAMEGVLWPSVPGSHRE